jgi:hypothetical protein
MTTLLWTMDWHVYRPKVSGTRSIVVMSYAEASMLAMTAVIVVVVFPYHKHFGLVMSIANIEFPIYFVIANTKCSSISALHIRYWTPWTLVPPQPLPSHRCRSLHVGKQSQYISLWVDVTAAYNRAGFISYLLSTTFVSFSNYVSFVNGPVPQIVAMYFHHLYLLHIDMQS